MNKTILLMSGGLDSTTLLYMLLESGAEVHCLTFDYGQTHKREVQSARAICKNLGVVQHLVKMPTIYERCALVGGQTLGDGASASAIVPNRNMILLSIAAAHALERGFSSVSWGVNADDEATFPDCRLETFIRPLREALANCHTVPVNIYAPFIDGGMTKRDVYSLALRLGVPIDETWSCYHGGNDPCGKCGACVIRDKATNG